MNRSQKLAPKLGGSNRSNLVQEKSVLFKDEMVKAILAGRRSNCQGRGADVPRSTAESHPRHRLEAQTDSV